MYIGRGCVFSFCARLRADYKLLFGQFRNRQHAGDTDRAEYDIDGDFRRDYLSSRLDGARDGNADNL